MIGELVPIRPVIGRTIHPLHSWRSDVHDVPLPGDEHTVVEYKTGRAVERDNHLNREEVEAYKCTLVRLRYHTPVCLSLECTFCGGLKDGDLKYFRHALDI